jgi:hypothetical protein
MRNLFIGFHSKKRLFQQAARKAGSQLNLRTGMGPSETVRQKERTDADAVTDQVGQVSTL